MPTRILREGWRAQNLDYNTFYYDNNSKTMPRWHVHVRLAQPAQRPSKRVAPATLISRAMIHRPYGAACSVSLNRMNIDSLVTREPRFEMVCLGGISSSFNSVRKSRFQIVRP
jgi:hypothetical protein